MAALGSPAQAAAPARAAGSEAVVASHATAAAEAADKLMNQVVQTVRSFQTSAGPALEARVSDPALGDVRMVVTGRAGEVVQAQLIVRDRAAADAISQAAARLHGTSDALTGVSLTVRSESSGSAAGNRSGTGFDASAWTAAGYGSERGGGDANRGNNQTNPDLSAGTGSSGQGAESRASTGHQNSAGHGDAGSHQTSTAGADGATPAPVSPARHPILTPRPPFMRPGPVIGGPNTGPADRSPHPSLDIRA